MQPHDGILLLASLFLTGVHWQRLLFFESGAFRRQTISPLGCPFSDLETRARQQSPQTRGTLLRVCSDVDGRGLVLVHVQPCLVCIDNTYPVLRTPELFANAFCNACPFLGSFLWAHKEKNGKPPGIAGIFSASITCPVAGTPKFFSKFQNASPNTQCRPRRRGSYEKSGSPGITGAIAAEPGGRIRHRIKGQTV